MLLADAADEMSIWAEIAKDNIIRSVVFLAAYFGTHPLTAMATIVGAIITFFAKFYQVRNS